MHKTDYLEKARQAKRRIKESHKLLTPRDIEHLLGTDEIEGIITLYLPAFNKNNSFRDRLKAFLKAENEVGRRFGKVLDLVSFFDSRIETARDFVRERIIPRL